MDKTAPGPKLYVFVLMPFAKEFDDVYQLGIKAACEELDMYCERIDETHMLGPIYDKIVTSISKADVIVADLTGRNANVYYEIGFAHALSKVAIHLCQDVKEIPFDLRGFQHVVYSGRIVDLKAQLKAKLEWAREFLKTKGEEIGSLSFDFYSGGSEISATVKGDLKKTFTPDGRAAKVRTDIQVDILNSGASESQRIGPVYIYTPALVSMAYNPRHEKGEQSAIHAASEIDRFDLRHQIDFRETFAAGEWKSLPLVFHLSGDAEALQKDSLSLPMRIRFLTESTPLDLDVSLEASITSAPPAVSLVFAQEESPEEISIKPQVTYERDGSIDEAGFQIPVGIRNLSGEEQKLGPLYVYTDDSIVKFDPSTSGLLILGIGGSYHEHSDEEGYARRFVQTNVNELQPYAYESAMFGFELDSKQVGRALTGLTIPIMVRVFTDRGPIKYAFNVKLVD